VAGRKVQDRPALNLDAAGGLAVREFSLRTGFSGYPRFVDRRAAGVIQVEAIGSGSMPGSVSMVP
jgi:type I restriction enzyme R subunit